MGGLPLQGMHFALACLRVHPAKSSLLLSRKRPTRSVAAAALEKQTKMRSMMRSIDTIVLFVLGEQEWESIVLARLTTMKRVGFELP